MKKIILYWIFLIITSMVDGQNAFESLAMTQDQAKFETTLAYYKNGEYLNSLIELNSLLQSYPTAGGLYWNRGLTRIALNDVIGARKDFLLAKWAGYKEAEAYIESFTSKEVMAKKLLKSYGPVGEIDTLNGFRPFIIPADSIRGALRPERTCFNVYFYDLNIRILPESKSIEGSNLVFFKTTEDSKVIQLDLNVNYAIKSVRWKGKNLNYVRRYNGIFIDFGEIVPAGSKEEVFIEYSGEPRIAPRPPWDGGFTWEKEKGRHWIGVACEHLGASSWWPNKDHLSDKPDSMRITLQVPKGYQGISNGNLRSQTELIDNYTSFEWFVSYPINNYNVTCYVGDFVNFNEEFTNQNGSYQIDYYVLPRNLEKAKKFYTQTKDILSVFEKIFGEYPFVRDGVAMVESPFEGMEHQGAIAIGGEYGKSNNKRDYWSKEFDYLVVHETAHEWWGNALAIGDMADAWINEGFATYAEYLFAEEKFGYPEYLRAFASNSSRIFNLWPVVGRRDINDNTFASGDVYNKGAAMLNNLRCIMNNDTLFKRIIKDFYGKYKYKIVTTDDFINLVKDYTKADYSDFFKIFLYGTDPPILSCNYRLDSKNNLVFNYRWMNVGKNFSMPFCIALNGKEVIRLNGTPFFQTFTSEKVKTFYLPNSYKYDKDIIPPNSFTYYWTSWPF